MNSMYARVRLRKYMHLHMHKQTNSHPRGPAVNRRFCAICVQIRAARGHFSSSCLPISRRSLFIRESIYLLISASTYLFIYFTFLTLFTLLQPSVRPATLRDERSLLFCVLFVSLPWTPRTSHRFCTHRFHGNSQSRCS